MSTQSPSSPDKGAAVSFAGRRAHTVAGGQRRWHLSKGALAVATLALMGATVFFYPSAASWLSQYDQSLVVVDLGASSDQATPAYRAEALAAAHAYNNDLVAGAHLVANSRKPSATETTVADDLYFSLLNGDANGAMGRLRIPTIDVDLPIYHGTDDATLEKGVGHLQGTSLPVGGSSTHSVLTAHRGLASATLFDRLDEMNVGDTFRIEVFGEVLTYRVIETKVVEPTDTASLFPRYSNDLVTLVTCTPLGINSHRILVTAERLLPTPSADLQAAGSTPDIPGVPWWAIGLVGTATTVAIYVWHMGRPVRITPRQHS